ncbi:SDR family oxidoreductase [Nocardia sp. NBC_01499]|uniref:SDR family oxidoreductase n=1 Tax=Nocardia sp. NBC_01499 TaxID=2903597 RepID=UPI00386918BB
MTGVTAISGASGHIGGQVARVLSGTGISTRLLGRDPERISPLPAAVPVRIDFADPATVQAALTGVQTFLFVSATESADRAAQQIAVVETARRAGVERIVYLSFVGAAPECTFTFGRDHWYTEQAIRASGMDFTFLRDNQYQDLIPLLADTDGVIRGPAADGAVAAVTRSDVAAAAAAVLTGQGHAAMTYDLTGPRAFTLTEAAEMMTAAHGRQYTYVCESLTESYASRSKYAAPQWELDGWVSSYTAIATGELETVTDSIEQLTGHPATDFRDFLTAPPRRET